MELPEPLVSEMAAQPALLERWLSQADERLSPVVDALERAGPRAYVLVARGSSDHAAVFGRYLLEVENRALVALAAPSTVTLYGAGPRLEGTAVLAVSQSGRGEDILRYVMEARAQGAVTVAVVNDVASPLAATAEWVIPCDAGAELSVPATKTVTAQMAVLLALSRRLSRTTGCTGGDLAHAAAGALSQGAALAPAVETLLSARRVAVVGRGFAYPVALELALKLKEMANAPAEAFSAADFAHGPLTLVQGGFVAVVVDVGGRTSEAADAVEEEIDRRGGASVRLSVGPSARGLSEPEAAIAAVVQGQVLAAQLALAQGLDPARPRGLQKVTSTR